MPGTGGASQPEPAPGERLTPDVEALIPVVRRVVASRVRDAVAVDDLVQETLVRVLGAVDRVGPNMIEPYAVVTARNVVATMWQDRDRHRRNQHRVVDLRPPESPDENLLRGEERSAVSAAMARLPDHDREVLMAHEVIGRDTRSLADERGTTVGAVAAHLNRARARLRVEYLLVLDQVEPPTVRCRPVLLALSLADRRRQRELDAARHVLECELCRRLRGPLLDRGQPRDDGTRIEIKVDSDVVTARRRVREVAAEAGFAGTDLTIIATAVSEVTRNIVKFAGTGEIVVRQVTEPHRGVEVVARDTGPGIVDV